MLTLFTLPRAFTGHFATIQRNAIRSWTLLRPACEIILIGDDAGVADIAQEFDLRHVPAIARNEHGKPFFNDIFVQAQKIARHDILAYVNADILLMNDFTRAAEKILQTYRQFLMIGQRWDYDIMEEVNFTSDWEKQMSAKVMRHGTRQIPYAMDYFLFRKGLWKTIPPFVVGRTCYDNWLLYETRRLGIPVIDATQAVSIIHQNHEFSYFKGDQREEHAKQEVMWNRRLVAPEEQLHAYIFNVKDATHILTNTGVYRALDDEYLFQRRRGQNVLDPPVLFQVKRVARKILLICRKCFPDKVWRNAFYALLR